MTNETITPEEEAEQLAEEVKVDADYQEAKDEAIDEGILLPEDDVKLEAEEETKE